MSSRQLNLRNIICMQRKDVPDIGLYGRLTFIDLKRIDLLISGDITNSTKCCLYTGKPKGTYCTISFRGKKVSLLRILYHNLIEDINPHTRINHTCENKGICCNLSHFNMDIPEIEENSNFLQEDPENDVCEDELFNFDL